MGQGLHRARALQPRQWCVRSGRQVGSCAPAGPGCLLASPVHGVSAAITAAVPRWRSALCTFALFKHPASLKHATTTEHFFRRACDVFGGSSCRLGHSTMSGREPCASAQLDRRFSDTTTSLPRFMHPRRMRPAGGCCRLFPAAASGCDVNLLTPYLGF